jgi:hypothetical protein
MPTGGNMKKTMTHIKVKIQNRSVGRIKGLREVCTPESRYHPTPSLCVTWKEELPFTM